MAESDDEFAPQVDVHGTSDCQLLFFDESSLCPEINSRGIFDAIERQKHTDGFSISRVRAYVSGKLSDLLSLPVSGLKGLVLMLRELLAVQDCVSRAVSEQNCIDMHHLCVKIRAQLRPSAFGGPRVRVFPAFSIFRMVNFRLCKFLFSTSWKKRLIETASRSEEKGVGGDGDYIFSALFDCFCCASKFFGSEFLCRVQSGPDVNGIVLPRYLCTGYDESHERYAHCLENVGVTAPVPVGVVLRALQCTYVDGVQYMFCAIKMKFNVNWEGDMKLLYTARMRWGVGVVSSMGGDTGVTRHCDVLCHCVWVPMECMTAYKHGICAVRYDTRTQYISVRFEPTVVNEKCVIQGE